MKKIFAAAIIMTLALSTQGQFKTIVKKQGEKAAEHGIISPVSKTNLVNTQRSISFAPQTSNFKRNWKNGLKVDSRNLENQLPILISGTPTQIFRSTSTPEGRAYNFLENAKDLLELENPTEAFVVVEIKTDDLGMVHIKFQQTFQGIPIYGSEIIYHEDAKNTTLNGRYQRTPKLESITPTVQVPDAENIVIGDLGGLVTLFEDKFKLFDFEKLKSELVVYEGRLVYHVTAYRNIVDRWEYFLDAHNGEIIFKHSSICKFHNHESDDSCLHDNLDPSVAPPPDGPKVSNAVDLFGISRSINTYEKTGVFYMVDAVRSMFDAANSDVPNDPVGAIWTIDAFNTSPQNANFEYDHVSSSSLNFVGKQTGVSAHHNGGLAYEYFKNVHNRESINGSGGNVIGLINISDEDGNSMGNAFWNGNAMFYGNGDNDFKPLARGLDVAGHEMSHGVVQSTANLVYQGESGALNESFADVFGAMIDREDWLIGEDVVKSSAYPSGALRSLENPHNGAATGDFNKGWQPRVYSERFTGSQDNGGVHFNSGIPNHAFYLFATAAGVGKERAEKVYYRALDNYITKSSKFIDARLAVVQAANDLYGSSVAQSAKTAWDAVEVFNGNSTTTQTDIEANPGSDLILFTLEGQQNLYIADAAGNLIFNPLTNVDPASVPSITDDGSEIVFVNDQGQLYYIHIDWSTTSIIEEGVITSNDTYSNAVFSRDGLRLAAVRESVDNEIFVYDFVSQAGNNYELFNPTYTEGVSTGDVIYADALQFDFTGEYLMYDAFNRIESTFEEDIEYWDIGFIKVFNNDAGTFALGTDIQKLFSQLPDGVSIGNPSFSKNSDYVIAFDVLENGSFEIFGMNLETSEIGQIFTDNDRLGYPSYSLNDDRLIFDAATNLGNEVVAVAELESNKIASNSASIFISDEGTGVKWGVWFGNGERVLADEDILHSQTSFMLTPNPAGDFISLNLSSGFNKKVSIQITDISGRPVHKREFENVPEVFDLDIAGFAKGLYILTLKTYEESISKIFVKE